MNVPFHSTLAGIDRQRLIARLEADQEIIKKVEAGLLTKDEASAIILGRVMNQWKWRD